MNPTARCLLAVFVLKRARAGVVLLRHLHGVISSSVLETACAVQYRTCVIVSARKGMAKAGMRVPANVFIEVFCGEARQ